MVPRCLLLDRANSVFWTRALNIPCPSSFVFPDQLPVPPALRASLLKSKFTGQQLDGDLLGATGATDHSENPPGKLACENDAADDQSTTHLYEIIANLRSINELPDCGVWRN